MKTLTITAPQLKAAFVQFLTTEREAAAAERAAGVEPGPYGVLPVEQVADVGFRRIWALLSDDENAGIDPFHKPISTNQED